MRQRAGMLAQSIVSTLVLVLAGCSAGRVTTPPPRNGEVGVQDLTATIAPAARIALADNENFLPPLPEPGNALPSYPPELLAQRLAPQVVCLRVSIDAQGLVETSAPLVQPPDCAAPDAMTPSFLAAAQAAVAAWRYDPAVRCVFAHGPRPDYPTCVGAQETPLAVSLTYRFVFEQQDGRGSVRTMP
ncbi:hypothetical protein ACFPN1_11080 [Lysobacter yangpyeongensis]|uniref:TonB C-terminal domain-containing protein n=1 Tax=Lysobacter yangpyeongensis TaxID=346182 RepID=A0ABW0SND9_9GAMM